MASPKHVVISRYFLTSFLILFVTPSYQTTSGCGDDAWRGRSLQQAVQNALSLFGQTNTTSNVDKLAVILLLTDLDRKGKDRVAMLRQCLRLCAANLFPTTPTSVYIFTQQSQVEFLKRGLYDLKLPNVAVMQIDNASWVVPQLAGDSEEWHSKMPLDYRLMGDWRLSYMPEFARAMGHRYLLQIDDDSFMLEPIRENLVQMFDRNMYVLAARQFQQDSLVVTWGLPELARYYLTTHKVAPTSLFEFCDPPSIEGVFSEFDSQALKNAFSAEELDALSKLNASDRSGWDRTILYGNFIMYSLEWWFRPQVNNFVQLCRATGGAFAYRWNEQGVIAMLWQIFVPKEQFYKFRFRYSHRELPTGNESRSLARKRRRHGSRVP